MQDKVIFLTGCTDGIGRLTAHRLAKTGATLLLHGRSAERLRTVVDEVKGLAGHDRVRAHMADYASLAEVRAMADRVLESETRIDVLINNAGIGSGGMHNETPEASRDGHELRFQVNYLAPVLLTRLLLPVLKASAPARIVNVSSLGQQAIDLDDVMMTKGYEGRRAYRQSKLALIMFTFDLAADLAGSGVAVNALHPGSLLNTKMVRETFGKSLGEPEEGADAELALATAPEFEGVSGRFFDGLNEARAKDQAYDSTARAKLRDLTETLIADYLLG